MRTELILSTGVHNSLFRTLIRFVNSCCKLVLMTHIKFNLDFNLTNNEFQKNSYEFCDAHLRFNFILQNKLGSQSLILSKFFYSALDSSQGS